MSLNNSSSLLNPVCAVVMLLPSSGIYNNQLQNTNTYWDTNCFSPYNYKNSSGIAFDFSQIDKIVSRTQKVQKSIDEEYMKIKERYRAIERSFVENKINFPDDKITYFSFFANSLSRLPFVNNFTEFDEWNDSIYSELKLDNGLNIKVTMFLEDDEEAPVVFSVFRGKALLISDELPIYDMVDTLNSIMKSIASLNEV